MGFIPCYATQAQGKNKKNNHQSDAMYLGAVAYKRLSQPKVGCFMNERLAAPKMTPNPPGKPSVAATSIVTGLSLIMFVTFAVTGLSSIMLV